jgi:hypothetical protein
LLVDGFQDSVIFSERRAGVMHRLVEPLHFRLDPDRWYSVLLQARGPDLHFSLDGLELLSARDDELLRGRVGIGTRNGSVRFKDIRVTHVNGAMMWDGRSELPTISPEQLGTADSALPPAYRKTNLLTQVNPSSDALQGSWSMDNGVLTSQGQGAQIEFGYAPAGEYEYRVSLSRPQGNSPIALIAVAGGRQFAFVVGGHRDTTAGFTMIGNADYDANPTTSFLTSWIGDGPAVNLVIRVQKDNISAYLNGQLHDQFRTDFSDLSLPAGWQKPITPKLGLWLGGDKVRIQSADVLEYPIAFGQPILNNTTNP